MARVLLFGPLRDLAGWRERTVEAASVAALTDALTAEDAELGAALRGPGVQVAVDQAIVKGDGDLAIVKGDAALNDNAEVAYLPPMSGG